LSSSPTPLASDDLEPASLASYDQRLDDPLLLDGLGELLERLLVEPTSRLVAASDDLLDGALEEIALRARARSRDQGVESAPKSPSLRGASLAHDVASKTSWANLR
jgi:hypothetical protein